MAMDPTYALSELFAFAGSSECQFLNMMQSQITRDIQFLPNTMELSVANLKYSKALLDEHVQRLKDTVDQLRNRELSDWPRVTQGPCKDAIDRALQMLLLDYEHLLSRAQSLATQCLDGTNIIMNSAMLEESHRSIVQTEGLTRLTLLAFFFLPLTFTTGFFGMNFKQLGNGTLSIWVLFVVLLPILALSTILCYWDSVSGIIKSRRKVESKFASAV